MTDLARATGLAESAEGDGRRLNRVLQLTGFSDPVYAEAFVTVHQYDIVMDVTVLNRTRETLQVRGLCVKSSCCLGIQQVGCGVWGWGVCNKRQWTSQCSTGHARRCRCAGGGGGSGF